MSISEFCSVADQQRENPVRLARAVISGEIDGVYHNVDPAMDLLSNDNFDMLKIDIDSLIAWTDAWPFTSCHIKLTLASIGKDCITTNCGVRMTMQGYHFQERSADIHCIPHFQLAQLHPFSVCLTTSFAADLCFFLSIS